MSWLEFIDALGAFFKGVGWVCLPFLALPFVYLTLNNNNFVSNLTSHLTKIIDGFVYGLGEMVKWTLPILVFIVALSVFADVVFGLAWTKLYESSRYLHAASILLGSAAALLANQHVRVDIFYARKSPRKKAMIDLCGYYLLLMPVCLLVLWKAQGFVSSSWDTFEAFGETDSFKGVQFIKTGIQVFCVTMLAQGLAISLRAASILSDGAEEDTPPHVSPLFPAEGTHHG